MQRLLQQGYCRVRQSGRKKTFEAIAPQVALKRQLRKLEDNLHDARELVRELTLRYTAAGETPEVTDCVEIVYGRDGIHHVFMELLQKSSQEILAIGKLPYMLDTPEKMQNHLKAGSDFQTRGGGMRFLFEENPAAQEWMYASLTEMNRLRIKVRIAAKLPQRMIIFDSRDVLVIQEDALHPPDEQVAAVIHQHTLADAYRSLFDFFWDQAQDYKPWAAKQALKSNPKERSEPPTGHP